MTVSTAPFVSFSILIKLIFLYFELIILIIFVSFVFLFIIIYISLLLEESVNILSKIYKIISLSNTFTNGLIILYSSLNLSPLPHNGYNNGYNNGIIIFIKLIYIII